MANNQDMSAIPSRDSREYHLYVTIQSAREASIELAGRINRKWKDELIENKKQLIAEIIDTYLPYAKADATEKEKLHLTDMVYLSYGEGEKTRMYDLNICNFHESIKPISGYTDISLAHWLALNEIDRLFIENKEREEKLSEKIFTEIVYMKEKEHIEAVLPEVMRFLRFEPFVYDSIYLSELIRKEAQL